MHNGLLLDIFRFWSNFPLYTNSIHLPIRKYAEVVNLSIFTAPKGDVGQNKKNTSL